MTAPDLFGKEGRLPQAALRLVNQPARLPLCDHTAALASRWPLARTAQIIASTGCAPAGTPERFDDRKPAATTQNAPDGPQRPENRILNGEPR